MGLMTLLMQSETQSVIEVKELRELRIIKKFFSFDVIPFVVL